MSDSKDGFEDGLAGGMRSLKRGSEEYEAAQEEGRRERERREYERELRIEQQEREDKLEMERQEREDAREKERQEREDEAQDREDQREYEEEMAQLERDAIRNPRPTTIVHVVQSPKVVENKKTAPVIVQHNNEPSNAGCVVGLIIFLIISAIIIYNLNDYFTRSSHPVCGQLTFTGKVSYEVTSQSEGNYFNSYSVKVHIPQILNNSNMTSGNVVIQVYAVEQRRTFSLLGGRDIIDGEKLKIYSGIYKPLNAGERLDNINIDTGTRTIKSGEVMEILVGENDGSYIQYNHDVGVIRFRMP